MIKCIISRRTRKREFNTSEQISSQIKRAWSRWRIWNPKINWERITKSRAETFAGTLYSAAKVMVIDMTNCIRNQHIEDIAVHLMQQWKKECQAAEERLKA